MQIRVDRRKVLHEAGLAYETVYGVWKQSGIMSSRYLRVGECDNLDMAEHWAKQIGFGRFLISDHRGDDVAEFDVYEGEILGIGCN